MKTLLTILAYPFVLLGALVVAIPHTFVLAWKFSRDFVEKQTAK